MRELLELIGQIFLITCIQSVLDVFVDYIDKPHTKVIVDITCYVGLFYLTIQFIVDYFLRELISFLNICFK